MYSLCWTRQLHSNARACAGPEVLSEAPKSTDIVVQGPDMRAALRPSNMTLRQRWAAILGHLLGGSSSVKLLGGILVCPAGPCSVRAGWGSCRV